MPASPCVVPDSISRPYSVHEVDCRVKTHDWVNGEYRRLVLSAPRSVLDCEPGQFFHLLCPQMEGLQPYLRRPMSIYSYDRIRGELSFLYKVAGTGTGTLARLQPGEHLNIVGPLGRGFEIRREWRRPLLVARGVGLATLAPLAGECARLGRQLTAVCSARSPDLVMSTDLFRFFGAEVITVTDAEDNSDVKSLTLLIEGLIRTRGIDAFFTCGSARLLRMLQEIGARHGIGGQVAVEQHMACGIGMCQACVRTFLRDGSTFNLRVCREGPVFDLHEVL
ncbi:dihydroorotate dehydrogenase electron transfer subunit [Oryzicola mucosus]|uniref:Dihydroorotate dehydrogenase electron transfer subunit n=1 Tax=Oryzicola mucosus TaxID=2767425 RepID=A0A8J6U5Y1_9HYPH|nr:dihydroorotate dehydrogenase electron transfer subunit [Oryzicola mucosus]MBD0417220.1 dihydroorotate dehydrogenase electron transfer subunit [Oryzicola mucosus]